MLRRLGKWFLSGWRWYQELSAVWQVLIFLGISGAGVTAFFAAVARGMDPLLGLLAGVLLFILAGLGLLIFVEAVKSLRRDKALSAPRLALWLEGKEAQVSWTEGPGPLLMHPRIGIRNKTEKKQENIQVQFQLLGRGHMKGMRPETARWVLTQPFSLKRDDFNYVILGAYEFDKLNSTILIPIRNPADHLKVNETPLPLEPGSYTINLEVTADDAPMARLSIHADCKDGRWEITETN